MKQVLLFLTALFFLSFSSIAQLEKKTWLVGGSGSFYTYTEDYSTPTYNQTSKYTSIDVAASIGYFLADKFVVGLRPSFSSYKGVVVNTTGGTNQYKLSVGPFVRYYSLKKRQTF